MGCLRLLRFPSQYNEFFYAKFSFQCNWLGFTLDAIELMFIYEMDKTERNYVNYVEK